MATKTFIEFGGMMIDAHSEAGHEILLKDLQNARNYSMEANLGDYSMASINRAAEQVKEAKKNLIDAGYESSGVVRDGQEISSRLLSGL